MTLLGSVFLWSAVITYCPAESTTPHPRIHEAIRAIEGAKKELQEAPHDFGGHREDAVEACSRAIEQLKQALAYEKSHEKTKEKR